MVNRFSHLGRALSKEEQKEINGGLFDFGTRCVVYCCDNNGNCGSGTRLPGVGSCQTNEECQSIAVQGGATCPSGYYVAGLCKG
ncbi:MAG: hypothetical protein IT214_14640 [Chitinophagaceae bacterium]|nr:hypothetical protein [Chitinophagaceae bacterium]